MVNVTFDTKSLSNQTFSSTEKSVFFFNGRNHEVFPISIIKDKVSCGCVFYAGPEIVQPNEYFTVKVTIDKVGQSGFTAQYVILRILSLEESFEHGTIKRDVKEDVVKLEVSGTIK